MNIEELSINVHGSNRFWSTITQSATPKDVVIWEQIETSETRQEAFDRAENALHKIIDAAEEERLNYAGQLSFLEENDTIERVPREDFKDE